MYDAGRRRGLSGLGATEQNSVRRAICLMRTDRDGWGGYGVLATGTRSVLCAARATPERPVRCLSASAALHERWPDLSRPPA